MRNSRIGGRKADTGPDPAELVRRGQPLAEHQVKDLLRRYGITVPPHVVLPGGTPEDELTALPFPFPVVVKVSDAGILHKTELGGVRLGIQNEAELQRVLAEMRERFPDRTLLVEAQEPPGVEVIVGLIHDATFGPSLMFGLGGIFTELYEDVAFRVTPITAADAVDMISQVKAQRLFTGFRGMRASQEAVVSVLLAVSRLAEDLGSYIEQMDLNPVIVSADRAVVVDAKLRLLRPADGQDH